MRRWERGSKSEREREELRRLMSQLNGGKWWQGILLCCKLKKRWCKQNNEKWQRASNTSIEGVLLKFRGGEEEVKKKNTRHKTKEKENETRKNEVPSLLKTSLPEFLPVKPILQTLDMPAAASSEHSALLLLPITSSVSDEIIALTKVVMGILQVPPMLCLRHTSFLFA